MQRTKSTALMLFGMAVFTSPVFAGPLTPPAGPVISTMKTLTEVEPRIAVNDTNTPPFGSARHRIVNPGSYYLTGDVITTGRGIAIETDGVTLDLNGFTVRGDGVGTSSDIGILVTGAGDGLPVVIQNGYVENFTGDGVDSAASSYNVNASNVHVRTCNIGFDLLGWGTLTDCSARDCVNKGFEVFMPVTFTRCIAEGNPFEGFFAATGSVFRDCLARNNGSTGFAFNPGGGYSPTVATVFTNCVSTFNGLDGFHSNHPATYTACIARNNSRTGFLAIEHASVSNCLAEGNLALGFSLGPGSSITNSIARSNESTGISALEHSSVSNCSSFDNTFGFNIGDNSTVVNCTATSSLYDGFVVGNACVITACTSNANTENGFKLGFDCRITNCNADANGIAGIQGNSDVTIDSNTVTDNTTGIVGGVGGLVIRNTAAGNGVNYNMANSTHGGILSAGVGAFTTTNPFVNIEY